MTFDARERAIATGQPVRLYRFIRGADSWAYTTADRTITYAAVDYLPRAISDDGRRQTGETGADALTITGPASLEVAQLYRGVPPADEVSLTIRDLHYGDAEAVVGWVGSIQGVRFPAEDRAVITCQSLSASLDRPGLRLSWERGCPYALGDRNCTVEMSPLAVPGTINVLTGASITATAWAAPADGYFAGGYIEWTVGGATDRRGIESHTAGGVLALIGGTGGLALGQTVSAFPGCGRTAQICQDKFANLINYGGVPGLPGKSPFDGSPVF